MKISIVPFVSDTMDGPVSSFRSRVKRRIHPWSSMRKTSPAIVLSHSRKLLSIVSTKVIILDVVYLLQCLSHFNLFQQNQMALYY